MILALDLGTRCGWAFQSNESGTLYSGYWDFAPRRFEGGGMRYLRFEQKVAALHADHTLEAVYFEEVRFAKTTDAAQIYGGFLATLTAWCEKQGVKYMGVPVQTIKRFATGKGNASKDLMVYAAQKKGWNVTDDNEADALWILEYALKEFSK